MGALRKTVGKDIDFGPSSPHSPCSPPTHTASSQYSSTPRTSSSPPTSPRPSAPPPTRTRSAPPTPPPRHPTPRSARAPGGRWTLCAHRASGLKIVSSSYAIFWSRSGLRCVVAWPRIGCGLEGLMCVVGRVWVQPGRGARGCSRRAGASHFRIISGGRRELMARSSNAPTPIRPSWSTARPRTRPSHSRCASRASARRATLLIKRLARTERGRRRGMRRRRCMSSAGTM